MLSSYSGPELEFNCKDKNSICVEGICDIDRNQCKCFVGWLGRDCSNNIQKELPTLFLTWKIVMIFLNLALFVIAAREVLYKSKNKSKKLGNVLIRYKKSSDLSPKKLIFILILVMSAFKLAWFMLDPYLFNRWLPRIIERLMNELTFSMIFGIYATVLYIWYSLTENIFKKFRLEEAGELLQEQTPNLEDVMKEPTTREFPKIVLYFKHLGLPKAIVFCTVQLFASSLKNYKRPKYLTILTAATVTQVTIMILLIVEFLLVSHYLHKILSEEKKKSEEDKNLDDEEAPVEKNRLTLKRLRVKAEHLAEDMKKAQEEKVSKDLRLSDNIRKSMYVSHREDNSDEEDDVMRILQGGETQNVFLDFEESDEESSDYENEYGSGSLPEEAFHMDFGLRMMRQDEMTNLREKVSRAINNGQANSSARMNSKMGMEYELKIEKAKESLQSIIQEEIKFTENTLLKNAEDLMYVDSHENEVFKDERRVFNRILRMLICGLLFLLAYAILFILVYLLNTTSYNAGLTLAGLVAMELAQTSNGFVFYLILQNVNPSTYKNLKAIYILNSVPNSQKKYSLEVDQQFQTWKTENIIADMNV